MRQVSVSEAKSSFSALLWAVEQGEPVTITRWGRAVAHLVPATADRDTDLRREALVRFRAHRRRWKPTGMTTAELLEARHTAPR